MKFLVDREEALVEDTAYEFDVVTPIYVGGIPPGFVSPSGMLVCNDLRLSVFLAGC